MSPKTVINAAKTSVVMFSIVEGKARIVDYTFFVQIKIIGKMYYINMSDWRGYGIANAKKQSAISETATVETKVGNKHLETSPQPAG